MNDSIVIIALITVFVAFRSLPRESSRAGVPASVIKITLGWNNIYPSIFTILSCWDIVDGFEVIECLELIITKLDNLKIILIYFIIIRR